MTVCIAAIFDDSKIVNVSDRMISTGNSLIKYAPPQSKIFRVTDSHQDCITLMIAGDTSLQAEIIHNARLKIAKRKTKSKLTVKEVVDAYCEGFREIYFRQAESAILIPQCLTLKSYFEKQKKGELSNILINSISDKLAEFRMESEVEAIVSGIDEEGTHIYAIKNDEIRCESNNGYAAIGLGGWHAESQFMFAKYTTDWHLTDALFLAFKAKKRAEVAEGISEETDMLVIFPPNDDLSFVSIEGRRLEEFNQYYNDLERKSEENEQAVMQQLKKSYEESVEKFRIEFKNTEEGRAYEEASKRLEELKKRHEAFAKNKTNDKSNEQRNVRGKPKKG